MALDLSGIHNVGEFYSHHYLDAVLEGDLKDQLKQWAQAEKEGGPKEPAKHLFGLANRYFTLRGKADGERSVVERWKLAREFHAHLLDALGYPYEPAAVPLESGAVVPVLCSISRGGQPFLWVVDAPFPDGEDAEPLAERPLAEQLPTGAEGAELPEASWEELLDGELFRQETPPRWVLVLAGCDVFLIDRHKWPQGKYLHFELGELLGRRQTTALRATAALLHRSILAPDDGVCVHDTLDENSHKHAFAVSTDLKYGARRAIELIGNEAIRYRREVSHEGVFGDDELAGNLTAECLTYLYRLLFLFYVEARGGEAGVVPMKSDAYRLGYSLEALRDLELVPLTTAEARDGFFIHQSLERLFHIVNRGFGGGQLALPEEEQDPSFGSFFVSGLRSPLFDPERTPTLSSVKLRNVVLQEVLQLLSLSREQRRKGRGRISYAQLGINQLGAVYEGLLSYTGFFAKDDLYEVRAANEVKDEEARTYFVPKDDIDKYKSEELVRDEDGKPRTHAKGNFVFRLAGRDREKSASINTPELLTE